MEFSDKIRQRRRCFHHARPQWRFRFARIMVWVCILLSTFDGLAESGKTVAIFDFDDRGANPDELGIHMETGLKKMFHGIQVDHFCGYGDEIRSVGLLLGIEKDGYDLAIVRTSNALIIAQHTLFQTPTLYTNASNPLLLGFRTLEKPGGNISGASYYIPIHKHLLVYKAIQPSLARPGFIFDKNNQSRKVEVPEAMEACGELGLKFDMEFVEKNEQLHGAATALLARGADAVVAASSGVVYEHIDRFLPVTDRARIPVYSFYKTGAFQGAVAALSSDFFKLADEIVLPMARQVLEKGESPGTMPAGFLKKNRLFINVGQMEKLGLNLPDHLLSSLEVIRIGPSNARRR